MKEDNCPYKDDLEMDCEYCKYGTRVIPEDELEYAIYHGGYYEYYETVCMYVGENEDEQRD